MRETNILEVKASQSNGVSLVYDNVYLSGCFSSESLRLQMLEVAYDWQCPSASASTNLVRNPTGLQSE